ncbi:unnamed protein product, partial [Vitis vinifera]
MADSDSKPKQKHTKKKRKLKVPEDDRRPSKTQRFDFLEKEKEKDAKEERPIRRPEEGRPWGNLQLILSLQNKEILLQEKVQLAYDFVATRATEEEEDTEQGFETVSLSRVIIFLNDWIQSLLISSEKKSKVDLDKTQFQVVGTCLDFRCWEIFKFCLEESLERHVPLNISRNLLKAIHCIARNALSQLNDASLHAKESFFIVEGFELYGTVLSCVSLVFSSHNGLSNENLDLWISTVDAVLELVHKIYTDNIAGGNAGKFVLQFSCLVLEPFSKFLRVHPCRKNGFHDFVDKLLELLLHLLGVLNLQADGNNPGWTRDLLKLVEEVLSHGLFHPAHIDGFLSLHGKEKHGKEYDGQSEEPKMVVKSYHRHLFDKLEKIVAAKKVLPLSGIGELFHLLVVQVKKQKGALVLSEGTKIVGKTIMEPLLFQIKGYLQTKLEVGPALLDVHCTLKSTNKLLASFMHEKVYVQTEDTHEGACLNFLKVVYDRIMSFSVEINQMWLSTVDADKGIHVDTLNLIGKELIAALGYFLEIDYEVIGNDLVSLWLMMLSFLAIGLSSMDMSDQSSLSSKMVDVGCQLINLYSELRQVNNAIFALCKAVRLLVSHDSDCELNYSGFMSCTNSASYEACAKSVEMLLCSQEFKFAIYNAIRSIPEGQASECVRQLTTDISDSLKWMKTSCSVASGKESGNAKQSGSLLGFDLQVELLGKGLAEIYTLVLDSLNVTTGNSSLLGVSIEGLMTVMRPGMSSLVALQLDGVNEFISAVTERIFYNRVAECKNDFRKLRASTQWIFVLFFRLYMSCRSLYRQSISLVPPTSAKKMSAVMGDFYIAHTGRDWVEKTDWTEQGYFSWIVQPSASLPNIIQSILDLYPQDRVVTCSPLVYVLHTMALQRLVDLNRQIKSFEYLLQSNNKLSNKKKSRKWKRFIAVLREEATGLTDFMMGSVSLVKKHNTNEPGYQRKVSVGQISMELLSDTTLYEQKFVCRHIASRFCRNLEKSLSPLLSDAAYRDFDFNSSPNWQEVLSAFDNLSVVVSGAKLPTEFNEEKKAFLLQSMEFTACQSSLNLLCWMPKGYLNSRSFSLYTTCILNLERFVVCRLIKCHCALCSHNHYELYRLFLSCRRTLKHLIMAFCEEKMEASQSSLTSIFPEVSFPVLWLLKSVSVMVGLQHTFSEDRASQFRYMSFSLMDQTSYVFLMFSKSQFSHVSHLTETDPCSDSSKAVDAWKNVVLVAEALKEQTENLLISLKDALCNKRVEVGTVDLNRLSSLVSCFQGFMWGLASAMNHIDVKECDDEMKLLKWKNEPFSKLNLCINVFTDFIDFSLCMFLIEDDQQPEGLGEMRLQLDSAVCATNFLSDVDLFELRRLNRPLLRSLLKGDNPEAAFFLRELFIASSAILRLNLQINCIPLSSCFVPIFNGISQLLLLELANMADVPQPISLVWLDGVLKYLEELGNQFPLTNPTLYRDVYAKLIDLHLKAIGKCISLQGKRATLASHDAESSTKTLDIQEGCMVIYDVNTGSAHGGKVSSITAAGIDCLDLVLEFVSGRKRLSVVKRHLKSLIAGLFNIVLHLQSPFIFYRKLIHNKGQTDPDPGSVILMCIEVLTRISGKHALFQMDPCHLQQCLRIPAALFQSFRGLRLSDAPASYNFFMFSDNQDNGSLESMDSCTVDRQFTIDLFAACCRLLNTVLKHHKSECEQCIALLEDSVCVLLRCLETVDADSVVRKGYFSWEVEEGVKCACFLRRIYEEMRQQKDVFRQHCFKFLSNYIWIYSGYGPLKTGIRREIDDALRPGVYALIDACSADDLQYLHTVFGEGPCRSTLATLQHDYKLNFQYEGKV